MTVIGPGAADEEGLAVHWDSPYPRVSRSSYCNNGLWIRGRWKSAVGVKALCIGVCRGTRWVDGRDVKSL
jgi:hypothetical protein